MTNIERRLEAALRLGWITSASTRVEVAASIGGRPEAVDFAMRWLARRNEPRECAAGFTPTENDSMVRCDYCDRLCRRTGISGHKQHCGGWKMQYEQAR